MNNKKHISLDNKTILITGSPGFIGSNVAMMLLAETNGSTLISLDNMNDYYDPKLKLHRLDLIEEAASRSGSSHIFVKGDISDAEKVSSLFAEYSPDIVVNLAAQAGVRYSIVQPGKYISSNITGFYNILEACRHNTVEHLVFASSSSVYGNSAEIPFSTENRADKPVSLYAATKRSGEMLAYSYSKLYSIPCTGLRFFTVYGPAGRPDMAYFGFTNKLIKG